MNGVMAGLWTLKDYWECVEDKRSIWCRNWNRNIPLAAEAKTLLALVSTVERNIRGCEEGKNKNTHRL